MKLFVIEEGTDATIDLVSNADPCELYLLSLPELNSIRRFKKDFAKATSLQPSERSFSRPSTIKLIKNS